MGNGNIFVPLDRVEELENRIQDVPLALLNGSWVREEDENGNLLYYRQDVEVKGLSADSTPIILPKWSGDEPTEEESFAYDCLIGEPIITEGNVRFMANPIPQWSFTMVAKGAMASEGQDIDAVANLVAKVNELETEVDGLNRNMTPEEIEWTPTFTGCTLTTITGKRFIKTGEKCEFYLDFTATINDENNGYVNITLPYKIVAQGVISGVMTTGVARNGYFSPTTNTFVLRGDKNVSERILLGGHYYTE